MRAADVTLVRVAGVLAGSLALYFLCRRLGKMLGPSLHRQEGNIHFKAGRLQEALDCFTASLQAGAIDDVRASVLTSRALVYLKLNQPSAAATDCSAAITLLRASDLARKPSLTAYSDLCKALYRRADAQLALGRLEEAASDLEDLIRMEKENVVPGAPLSVAAEAATLLLGRVQATSNKVRPE